MRIETTLMGFKVIYELKKERLNLTNVLLHCVHIYFPYQCCFIFTRLHQVHFLPCPYECPSFPVYAYPKASDKKGVTMIIKG